MSEEKDAGSCGTPQQGKYSRYRSVRNTPTKESTPPVVPVTMPSKENESGLGRAKSMSRYRRSRIGSPVKVEPPPPMPTMPSMVEPDTLAALTGRPTTARRVTDPIKSSSRHQTPSPPIEKSEGNSMFPERQETEDERLRRKVVEFREREAQKSKAEEQKRQNQEDARIARRKAEDDAQLRKQQKAQAELEAKEVKLQQEETARLLEEQKRKDLERLEATLDAASPRTPSVTSPREKFNFFSRRRAASKAALSSRASASGSVSGTMSSQSVSIDIPPPPKEMKKRNASPPSRRVVRDPVAMPKKLAPEQMIQEGGGGIVPQTDAPISASNAAGERRVLIRCKQSSINLPITPETTCIDLIFSAANIMTQNIVPGSAILLESYTQLGLERRTRRYEHIRDVMNSWDRDTQNSFTIVQSESPQFDKDLEASSAPKEAPASTTVYMYHSQKPGKWNKRYITLLPTGQIHMSKRAPEKSSDKDIFNLCHLSDFDIYSSTPQQTRKVLKPPKKYCYAVKSQQKTTVFLSTENFVHYFSTDDETLSNKWYDAVQEWRSWYLVSRMGEVKRKKTTKKLKDPHSHTVTVSIDQDPYTIGTFTPLLNMDHFDKQKPKHDSLEREYNSDDSNTRPRQIPFHFRNGGSPEPMLGRRLSRRLPPTVQYRLPPEAEDEFSSGGLLGRTYSQRQKIQKERDSNATHSQGPFVDGPSLLNSTTTVRPERSMSMRSTRTTKRSQTAVGTEPAPGMPRPLLDFAPVFKEAPQWDRKGKGHGVKAVAGVPLVDVATTPEDVINAMSMQPNATVFRRNQDVLRPKTGMRPKTGREKEGEKGPFVGSGLVHGAGFTRPGGSNSREY